MLPTSRHKSKPLDKVSSLPLRTTIKAIHLLEARFKTELQMDIGERSREQAQSNSNRYGEEK